MVTGGSRGLGAAFARQCARAGARLVIVARDETALRAMAASISASGRQCLAVHADIGNPANVQECVDQAAARFGRVDILINNAGICSYGAIDSMGVDECRQLLDVNLLGAIMMTRAVVTLMRKQGGGDIVNIASGAALSGLPNLAAYSATKAGLLGFSRALGQELAQHRIRVFCPCPGWLDTDMLGAFPASAIPPRSKRLSADFVATRMIELLQVPHEVREPWVARIAARAAHKLRPAPFPVFRFS